MIRENDFLWFLQRRRSSTIDVRLISKYASAYILVSPIEIIWILNFFAVKYIFSDKRMKNIIPGQHQEFFIYFKSTDQSFKNFLNIFGRLLLGLTIIRGIFRTLSNIYNEAICKNNWGLEAVYYFLKKYSIRDVQLGSKYSCDTQTFERKTRQKFTSYQNELLAN